MDANAIAGIQMFPDYHRFRGPNGDFQIPAVRMKAQGFFATETSADPWGGW